MNNLYISIFLRHRTESFFLKYRKSRECGLIRRNASDALEFFSQKVQDRDLCVASEICVASEDSKNATYMTIIANRGNCSHVTCFPFISIIT